MVEKKQEKEKSDDVYEWVYFSRAYLLLAYWGVENLCKKITEGVGTCPFEEITPDFTIENNYVLAPILYNMKHAIEIFIKTLFLFISDIEPDHKHDLSFLFKKIKLQIKKVVLDKDLRDLETIITKYYKCEIIKDKIEQALIINDFSNDVFRYPRNTACVSFEFSQIFSKFTEQDVLRIGEDIKKLYILFYDVGLAVMSQKVNSMEEDEALIKRHPGVISKL